MRGRISLRQLKSNAANTLAQTNAMINKGQVTAEEARALIALVVGLVNTTSDFIEDLSDGINFEIGVPKIGIPLIDDILEKWGWKIPLVIRMDPREKQE
jgi:hypothetical protein